MVTTLNADMTIHTIVSLRPAAEAMLSRLGIDNCCGGHATLAEHCDRLRLDPQDVIRMLEEASGGAAPPAGTLEQVHAQLRELLPRAVELAGRVADAHGQRSPELLELKNVIESLDRGVTSEIDDVDRRIVPTLSDGQTSASELVARLVDCSGAHLRLRELLSRARSLTDGYRAPSRACGAWRLLMQTLSELEEAVLSSIHAEQNELFPAAMNAASTTSRAVA